MYACTKQDDSVANGLAQQGATRRSPCRKCKAGVLAGYTQDEGAAGDHQCPGRADHWHEQRLPGYLRQHAQQSAVQRHDSALPYARAASLESR
ncbi:anti sigma-E factor RseA C-terminal domain-containing protein [Pseudomonas denitrificans (nom. rej.)]|uniref:anti sigma-E factor RseA C-terminal domain-containing protein n=1 Tax=Pseudomonas denitrificans TaxID=43306 RepID=UPI001E5CD290|nr:anti sigma-E factor RseA C-terminal domain-containing protein [Pseudomonas denitrificans (nom. rej.)]